jgi:hypothetical protein
MMMLRADFKVSGDDSPETETKLSQVPVFECINDRCTEYRKEVTGEPNPIELGKV